MEIPLQREPHWKEEEEEEEEEILCSRALVYINCDNY